MAIFDINSKVHIQQLFLSLVELCSFCVSVLSQSKKNYELRCKEADEAEQGAKKTTSKNPDKVQQVNELPHSKNMSEYKYKYIQTFKAFYLDLHLCTSPHHQMIIALALFMNYKFPVDSRATLVVRVQNCKCAK